VVSGEWSVVSVHVPKVSLSKSRIRIFSLTTDHRPRTTMLNCRAMPPPSWVQDAIFYQIFPDRFANGDPSNDPANVQSWGSPPTLSGFQGGDLRGICQRLDYLNDLGITAIYLNPIFQAGSNHRYNTSDYLQIDDRLGTLQDFRELVDQAHDHGIRVVLDGVFNHSGRAFFAFQDLLDGGHRSAYRDWYHIQRFPLDAFGEGKAENYLAWWGFRGLPKFNTGHPATREYLLKVAKYWMEQGADGWRLDVPNEIDDDTFWAEFRQIVKRANPEAYLLGEIWTVDPRWVGPGAFDGLMNYPLRKTLLEWIVELGGTPSSFREAVEAQVAAYPAEHVLAQYNLLGSHDTERVATLAHGDARKVRLLYALMFALPGAPAIFYGDEIGLTGGKDPDSRRAFEWDSARWEGDRHALVRNLIQLRRSRTELRRGTLEFLEANDDTGTIIFARRLGNEMTLIVANVSQTPAAVRLPASTLGRPLGHELRDGLTGRAHGVGELGLELMLDSYDCAILSRSVPPP